MSTERQALSAEELEEQLVTELPQREAMTLIGTSGYTDLVKLDPTPLPPSEALPDSEPLPPEDGTDVVLPGEEDGTDVVLPGEEDGTDVVLPGEEVK